MKSVVRPELPTASVGSSQAPTAAVDNSAPLLTTPESTYKSRKSVQTTGATSKCDRYIKLVGHIVPMRIYAHGHRENSKTA
jgi:hypothetical protein